MESRSPLRLAWVNPTAPAPSAEGEPPARAMLQLLAPPPLPARPINLDLAIERHLAGHDGLTPEEFVLVFSGRAARAAQR